MKERELIKAAYQKVYGRDLIEHIESETSGYFKTALVAILECTRPPDDVDYEGDCNALKEAMDGMGTDEDALIRILAGKSPSQIQKLKDTWAEMFPDDGSLFDRVEGETNGFFESGDFRLTLNGL